MEWTLTILFVVSALLLIISILMTRQASKAEQKGIDMVHLSVMDDINNMQDSIRNIEFDLEIMAKEAGIQLSSEDRVFTREVLDLYNRKYSIESIAAQKKVSEDQIKEVLAPFLTSKDEGGKVANEN
ncbi:hypothetical protein [Bacillus sp. FJAT-49736]|uniref:hypothetical protein n=1 Tax=Bacillus sp. FJAT-49736 TaxID=2833582 RepID=UPI001BC992E7|nr:hypothetical protein [Bacillus sp. FJAT-49736]MBS4173028.1 hypothetical protein [Bacillus sp. FJAT-49736]